MRKQKKYLTLLIIVIFLFFAINYYFIDNFLINFFTDTQTVEVERVIDGDTIVPKSKELQESIRLLGINSPEKGEEYYKEAKSYLEQRIQNKSVRLEFGQERYDKYNRLLAYIFLNNTNINKELIEKGFANYYFPSGRTPYYNEFKDAWEKCIESRKNLCKPSNHSCSNCIHTRITSQEEIYIENMCSDKCDLRKWTVKAEGRDVFELNSILPKREKIIVDIEINDNQKDTIFLRDSNNLLVSWKEIE
ncbi:hypothetical protein GF378_03260 [Candidatus Pacearchaeota archaeon]|nr:hypothetical protein [Candidatus Pacearchaeota archaeon]